MEEPCDILSRHSTCGLSLAGSHSGYQPAALKLETPIALMDTLAVAVLERLLHHERGDSY